HTGETPPPPPPENHPQKRKAPPGPAVLFRDRAAEHPRLAGLQPYLARHDPILLPLVVVRTDLPVDEPSNHVAKLLVLGLEEASLKHGRCCAFAVKRAVGRAALG